MSASRPSVNRQFLLAAVPQGLPKESDFRLVETPITVPQDGQILLQSVYWSVHPYMRGRMTGIKTYADPVKIGELMVGAAVGKVIESRHPDYEIGDYAVRYW